MPQQIDGLTIRFPALAGYLTVSRLNAAAVGAAADFDLEELDDLRLAVNEAVTWLLADEEAGGHVELAFNAVDRGVEIVGIRAGDDLPPRRTDDLIEAILGATVDAFEFSVTEGGERQVRLVKAKAPTDAR